MLLWQAMLLEELLLPPGEKASDPVSRPERETAQHPGRKRNQICHLEANCCMRIMYWAGTRLATSLHTLPSQHTSGS